jgi:hypothetical protein
MKINRSQSGEDCPYKLAPSDEPDYVSRIRNLRMSPVELAVCMVVLVGILAV